MRLACICHGYICCRSEQTLSRDHFHLSPVACIVSAHYLLSLDTCNLLIGLPDWVWSYYRSSAIFTYGGVILVSAMGIMYIRGWKFSDFLYVTRASLQKSMSGVTSSKSSHTKQLSGCQTLRLPEKRVPWLCCLWLQHVNAVGGLHNAIDIAMGHEHNCSHELACISELSILTICYPFWNVNVLLFVFFLHMFAPADALDLATVESHT